MARFLALTCLVLAACACQHEGGGVPGTRGMVVCTEPLAAEAGLSMLRAGGNCVDAAVATAFALAVTWPAAGNLGGGGFMVLHLADGRDKALDFRETAPAAATLTMYLGRDGKPVQQRSTVGHLGVATPGSVPGLCHALANYGTLSLAQVLAPAIKLAEQGYPLSTHHRASLAASRKLLNISAESKRAFLDDAERCVQPELAQTLRRIALHGAAEFRTGESARLLVAEMQRGGGIVSAQDLAEYRVVERVPLRGSYRGHAVITMPPPSSGGVALLQMLGMLEARPSAAIAAADEQARHWIIEGMKRAFADRAHWMGDADQSAIPVQRMLSTEHIAALRDSIGSTAAPAPAAFIALPQESSETTHLSVVDGFGGAVALTTTLNGSFGCGVTVRGAGFLLNNEMDDFATAPGVPNMYGLLQAEANAIAPLRRPLSSMTPTILLRDGEVVFVCGSPGGPTIINTVLLTLLAHIDGGLSAAEAVAAPRFHHQWMPDEVRYEATTFSEEQRVSLRARGHRFATKAWGQGDCHAIQRDGSTGQLRGGADPRGGGRALGW